MAPSTPIHEHHSAPRPPKDTTEVSASTSLELEALMHAPNLGLGVTLPPSLINGQRQQQNALQGPYDPQSRYHCHANVFQNGSHKYLGRSITDFALRSLFCPSVVPDLQVCWHSRHHFRAPKLNENPIYFHRLNQF